MVYNSVNVKWFNYQLNNLKLGRKNDNEVTLKFPSKVMHVSNNATNFIYKSLRLYKVLAINLSADIKLLKTQPSKLIQSGEFLQLLKISLGPYRHDKA